MGWCRWPRVSDKLTIPTVADDFVLRIYCAEQCYKIGSSDQHVHKDMIGFDTRIGTLLHGPKHEVQTLACWILLVYVRDLQ